MAVSISGTDGITLPSGADITGKNQCTAWVNFDGTTTPPTIRDSYNVSQIIRTATGQYDVYFKEPMDNNNYAMSFMASDSSWGTVSAIDFKGSNKAVFSVKQNSGTANVNVSTIDIQIFGGKN